MREGTRKLLTKWRLSNLRPQTFMFFTGKTEKPYYFLAGAFEMAAVSRVHSCLHLLSLSCIRPTGTSELSSISATLCRVNGEGFSVITWYKSRVFASNFLDLLVCIFTYFIYQRTHISEVITSVGSGIRQSWVSILPLTLTGCVTMRLG